MFLGEDNRWIKAMVSKFETQLTWTWRDPLAAEFIHGRRVRMTVAKSNQN